MQNGFKQIYPVIFTVCICAVSALILTTANVAWKDAIAELEALMQSTAVLRAFDLLESDDLPAQQILDMYKSNITITVKEGFTQYTVHSNGVLQAVGFNVEGTGRCGLMRGIMGVSPDRRTIRAFNIYFQEETPGLGSKVGTPEFLDQFQGKSIFSPDNIPGMKIARGEAGQNEIDAISGATMTSKAVVKILNASISQFIAGRKLVPLKLTLPEAAYNETPSIPADSTAVMPFSKKREILLVPDGVDLLSLNKPVTASDDEPMLGTLEMVTDGDKAGDEDSFVELFMEQQHVQIDLGDTNEIYAIVIWHNHDSPVIYRDVVVQVSDDPEFTESVTTVFNNDGDDSAGMGKGTDIEYVETYEGKLIPVKGVKGRHVRLYSTGSTGDEMNRYVEVEVWGK
jgi:RnfABCDGE-type electron transport complex G subunit